MKLAVAALFAFALSVPAWTQDKGGQTQGDKQDPANKFPPKDGGDPAKKPGPKEGDGKAPVKGGGEDPSLSVAEVDTNGDGRISASELKAALGRLYPKKDGGGGAKDGGAKKPGAPDGAPPEKKEAPKDGGDVKKPVKKEGGPSDKPSKEGDK